MSKSMRQKWLTGTLVIWVIFLTPESLWSQIAGRVQKADGSALSGATVEVWDSYPTGSILTSGTTNGSGQFALGAVVGSEFDLRVRKGSYFPTVVRDLPQPTTNTSARLKASPGVPGNPNICDFWHASSTFLGSPVAIGDVVESIALNGSTCGAANAVVVGGWLVHGIGDDPSTGAVDGPVPGEQISFKINGLAAALNNAPVTFLPFDSKEAQLTGSATVHGITLTGPLDAVGSAGNSAFILFEVTNSGSVAGDFTVEVELDQAWTVIIQSVSGLALNLQPGESADVVAEIQIPNGTPDMDVEVRARVASDTYGQANSGAWTNLSVSTTSDVGDNGSGLIPYSFSLAQNYPNPFNAGTNIAYNLEDGGYVHLTVCNLLGQSIRTLVDGYRESGIHNEAWDGRDDRGAAVPSGIYFSRLLHDDRSLVRKMVLLK